MGVDRSTVRLLMADDHPIFRLGLSLALKSLGFVEVSEAVDGQHAVDLCRQRHYDAIILDVRMPRLNGVEAARRIMDQVGRSTRVPRPIIVMLTTYDEPAVVNSAAAAGASAFLSKETEPKVIARIIDRLLAEGERSLVPYVDVPQLSPRELEVLELVVAGATGKEIAVRLGISTETVKDHVARVYAKLGVSDRVGAVNAARRIGWTFLGEMRDQAR